MTIIQALLAEHVVFHNLFDHIEGATPQLKTLAEVRRLAGLLEALLKIHSLVEDQLLIAPLEPGLIQMGQDDSFHGEHQEIDATLARIQQTRSVAEARRLLLKAVVASRKHFDKEERIIFPMAQQVLKSRTLLELGTRWAAERKTMGR